MAGNGEEEKSTAIQISVCRAFRGGLFATGSSVVLFVLIALTPVCQFHPLAASLLLLFALAGAHKSVIFAGENSELNLCAK